MKKYLVLRRLVVLALVLIFFLAAAVIAHAATQNGMPEGEAQGAAVEANGHGGMLFSAVSNSMEQAAGHLAEAGQGLLAIPDLIKDLLVKTQDPDYLVLWGEMAGKILLVLFAGFLAKWIIRRMLKKPGRFVEKHHTDNILFRVVLITARTVLDIIPIGVFAVAAYGVLPFTDPRYETQLIALTLVNASVLAWVILAVFRMVLAPGVPSLRLLPAGEESVFYIYIWVRRLAGLGVYGYFILEAALLMGVPEGLYVFLMKFLGLVITLLLVILVMQNKNEVAGWLRAEKAKSDKTDDKEDNTRAARFVLALRSRLADFWHVAAVVLVVGLFAVWVLEIEGGLFFLASGLVMTALVVGVALLLVRLVHQGADRMFQISEDSKAAYPNLEDRANRYQPAVRNVLKAVVCLVAVFAILEVWGLGTLGWLFSPPGWAVVSELARFVLIIAGAFLLWEIVSAMVEHALSREERQDGPHTRKLTLLPLLKNVVRITIVLVAAMLALSQIGINIGPLIAGAGVIGLAIGFGAQTLVKDIITGVFIILEDSISVGDWVEAGGHSGTVERLTVRTVTLRDLGGTLQVVPFGEITTVNNYNRDFGYALIDAGVAYRERYGDVVQALQDVSVALRKDEVWGSYIVGDLEVFGLNNISDSSVEIRVRLKTLPMRQFSVRRAFLEQMKRVFDERNIEIPFPHRTIWFGADKNGAAPPMYLASNKTQKDLFSDTKPPVADPDVQIVSESEASDQVMEEKEQAGEEDRSENSKNE